MIVSRMSSGPRHTAQVRVLVMEGHVLPANRIGEGLRVGRIFRAKSGCAVIAIAGCRHEEAMLLRAPEWS